MAELLDRAARLSQVIGARPGGTEEEQQASFFIEDAMQTIGLETTVEEFNCNPNYELPKTICAGVTILMALLSVFLPLLTIPAFIVTAITAVLFTLESTGVAPLSKTAQRGISQNVIGKYIPAIDAADEDNTVVPASRAQAGRKRKVIIVARYDSGSVSPFMKPSIFKALPIIYWVKIGGMVAIPLFLLIRILLEQVEPMVIFMNVLIVAGILITLVQIVSYVLKTTAPFSDGANNNASGVAVMTEVAKHIAATSSVPLSQNPLLPQRMSGEQGAEAEDHNLVVMHGEEALREENVLPDGVELVYEDAESSQAPEFMSAHEDDASRHEGATSQASTANEDATTVSIEGMKAAAETAANLGAAAVGTLGPSSGDAISRTFPTSVRTQTNVRVNDNTKERTNVPDWFKKGMEKAAANKKTSDQGNSAEIEPAARSRFSDALDAAAVTSAKSIEIFEAREREAAAAKKLSEEEVAAVSAVAQLAATNAAAALVSDAAAATPEVARAAENLAQAANAQAVNNEIIAEQAKELVAEGVDTGAFKAIEVAAEEAAVTDRTISFIPVANEISAGAGTEVLAGAIADAIADTITDGAMPESNIDTGALKTASDILEEATVKAVEAGAEVAPAPKREKKRRTLNLPSLTGALGKVVSVKQDAPLAEDAERAAGESRGSLNQSRGEREALSRNLPVIGAAANAAATSSAANTSNIAIATSVEGATSSIASSSAGFDAEAAINSLNFAEMDDDELIVQDVDDSAYTENVTSTGAMAGPGYLEMPKSRVSRIKNFFGKQDKKEEQSFAEAMGISSDWEARKVGSERGGWESFLNESNDYESQTSPQAGNPRNSISFGDKNEGAESEWSDEWNGGGFSEKRRLQSSRGERGSSRADRAERGERGERGSRGSRGERADRGSRGERASSAARADRADRGSRSERGSRAGAFDSIADKLSSLSNKSNSEEHGAQQRRISADELIPQQEIPAEDMINEREQIRRFNDASPFASNARISRNSNSNSNNADDYDNDYDDRVYRGAHSRPLSPKSAEAFEDAKTAAVAADAFDNTNTEEKRGAHSRPLNTNVDKDDPYGVKQHLQGEPVEPSQPEGAFPMEVWFVALGAELCANAGMKNFLANHDDELSGAIVIEIEAMGAGTLAQITNEGTFRHIKAPSRMKRFVTKAGTALGLRVNGAKMNWCESSAYFAAEKGLQTIHLAGLKDGKPQYLGEKDDVFDNLNEETMLQNTAYLLELMRTI